MRARTRIVAAAAAIALAVGGTGAPAAAQEGSGNGPREQLGEGARQIMDALEGLLRMMPRYGMPRVNENGDIVIPRLDEPNGDGSPDGGQGGEEPKEAPDEGLTQT